MINKGPMVAPSLFAADFYNLSRALTICESSKVDMIHYDVMDNHFVSNISFGPKVIGDIIARTCLPADVHLMITLEKIDKLLPYTDIPVQHITLHIESMKNSIPGFLEKVRQSGKTVGLSLRPGTDIYEIKPYLDMIDLVLVMSVEPGYSGQTFKQETYERISALKEMIGQRPVTIQVDGGITRKNYEKVLDSGACCLVIGNHFFEDGNTMEWVGRIKKRLILKGTSNDCPPLRGQAPGAAR
jgi:ribulose-phosphate 3-epimerase